MSLSFLLVSCVDDIGDLASNPLEGNINELLRITGDSYDSVSGDLRCNIQINYNFESDRNIDGVAILKNGVVRFRITDQNQPFFVDGNLSPDQRICYVMVFYREQNIFSQATVQYCVNI